MNLTYRPLLVLYIKLIVIIILNIILKISIIYNNNISKNRDFLFTLNYT